MKILGRYILNVLIGFNQLGNAMSGGDPDETISSRLGKLKRKYKGTIPWFRPLSGLIDWGLGKIDPGHTTDAIEEDEGDDGLFM